MDRHEHFRFPILGGILPTVTLVLTIAMLQTLAAFAQDLPTTAREQAASRPSAAALAHPVARHRRDARDHRAKACPSQQNSGQLRFLPLDDILYYNGPTLGTTNALFIDVYQVSNSFPGAAHDMTGFDIAVWTPSGATPLSIDWSVGTSSFGHDVGSGSSLWTSFTLLCHNGSAFNGGMCGGGFGYDVYNAHLDVGDLPTAGSNTFWLTLTNASDDFGGRDGWDVNSGPSMAFHNLLGAEPSESFSIEGSGAGNRCMPEHDANFNVIYDFAGMQDGGSPAGLAIDRGGNLYGPTNMSGQNGTVFKLAPAGSNWSLSTLYTFLGGSNGSAPSGMIVGPKGLLYGAAEGGLQNCNNRYCGMVFDLGPSPNIVRTNWAEHPVYDFTALTDAYNGGGLIADQAGNLFGVSEAGGALQRGAVFKLSPSPMAIGSWIESLVYSFSGASDGGNPTTIVVGHDGKIYGMAASGGPDDNGVVFQLTPSGSGWSESVLYDLPNSYAKPRYLVQDSEGNLFGIYDQGYDSVVFMLTPSNGQWVYTELKHGDPGLVDKYNNLTIDTAGNLYGTATALFGCPIPTLYGYIFKLTRTGNDWTYSTPVYWDRTEFFTSGALALDSLGNLYGTTYSCGTHNEGTVWELTP